VQHLASEDAMAVDKLYIYDSSSEADIAQADGRFDEDEVYTIAVPSTEQLLAKLDRLVTIGARFTRVLFQTHGGPGHIKFDNASIWDITLKSKFAPRNYHTLFPQYTRIYFDGCNVADGDLGTEFLQAVGAILLKTGGGEAFGYTSPGYGVSGWVPFFGGHTLHFSGQLKKLYFKPGGIEFTPPPPPAPTRERIERGFKV
jgi:hypothetical protein